MISESRTSRSMFRVRSTRPGLTVRPLLGVVAGMVLFLAAGFWGVRTFRNASAAPEFITERAKLGVFVHDIVERGELESSDNVAVRCEVQSRSTGSNGVKILEIVPEGTVVKQGDFLVKFDDAALQADRTTQQINVSSAEAAAAVGQST